MVSKIDMEDYGYEDIDIGKKFGFRKVITASDISRFASLTGDRNPLHTDSDYAKSMGFKGRVAHGMLVGGLFSTLLGMMCPGKRNLYMSQSLNFRNPVYAGDEVEIRGVVKEKVDSIKLVVIKTEIVSNGEIKADGEAKVKVLGA